MRLPPLKCSAVDASVRVQASPRVNFTRWKFFLGYSTIPNPDQPWRGSVLTRKMSGCGNGSPHWENKTHILLMVGWGLSCPHTKKSMWHSFRTKVSRDPLWKGANFSYRENTQGLPLGKQCWWVTAGTRVEVCFPWLPIPIPYRLAGMEHPSGTPCPLSHWSAYLPSTACSVFIRQDSPSSEMFGRQSWPWGIPKGVR